MGTKLDLNTILTSKVEFAAETRFSTHNSIFGENSILTRFLGLKLDFEHKTRFGLDFKVETRFCSRNSIFGLKLDFGSKLVLVWILVSKLDFWSKLVLDSILGSKLGFSTEARILD